MTLKVSTATETVCKL